MERPKKRKNRKKSKLWEKLFGQAIPFFALLYMSFAICWISADYVLAFLDKSPVGELTVTLANGIVIAIISVVISSAFDHWLQDHYKVDNNGTPREIDNGQI